MEFEALRRMVNRQLDEEREAVVAYAKQIQEAFGGLVSWGRALQMAEARCACYRARGQRF